MKKLLLKFFKDFDLVDKYRFEKTTERTVQSVKAHCVWGKYLIDPKTASVIEKMSKGQITRQMMRPDDWHIVWPELATKTSDREFTYGIPNSHANQFARQ